MTFCTDSPWYREDYFILTVFSCNTTIRLTFGFRGDVLMSAAWFAVKFVTDVQSLLIFHLALLSAPNLNATTTFFVFFYYIAAKLLTFPSAIAVLGMLTCHSSIVSNLLF